MNRGNISSLLRNAGLLRMSDYVRFNILKVRNRSKNLIFQKRNPNIKLPPDYLLYESFDIDYSAYFDGGKESAHDLYKYISRYKSEPEMKILDWGCGPGRIIRHLPDYFGDSCSFFGTDYNEKSIKWCTENIPNIDFTQNSLSPPLDFENSQFHIIYGISIFTHLSEDMHYAWIKELYRVLGRNGILLITTAGNAFISKLTPKEKSRFERGELIIRSKVKEGHRTFAAFHPVSFMQDILSEFNVLEHIERNPVKDYLPQDIWIVQKM
jgi:SAM-dependent methyltransferase